MLLDSQPYDLPPRQLPAITFITTWLRVSRTLIIIL